MSDQFKPVAGVAFSESNRQANHPTPGTGNVLRMPPPVEDDFMDDEPDASDVTDAAEFTPDGYDS
jgi:hypothetical protein